MSDLFRGGRRVSSRCRTIVVFAVLVALSATLAACGSDSGSTSSGSPQQIANEATLQGVESGKLDIWGEFEVQTPRYGHVFYRISGPFQDNAETELPELDIRVRLNGTINGERIDFEGTLTLLSGKAYIGYGGTEYEVDPAIIDLVRAELAGLLPQSSEAVSGCREAAGGIKPADLIDNLESEGKEPLEGTSTTRLTGDLDVAGLIDTLIELAEESACSELLHSAGPSPADLERARRPAREALKEPPSVEASVGDDHILREFAVQAPHIELPKQVSDESGAESLGFALNFSLGGVNEGQTIQAPRNAKPLSDAGDFLGCLVKVSAPADIQNCANLLH